MATFTVTTTINFDDAAFTTRAGGDTYNIDGGKLVIDTDTRYCKNATGTTGNIGPVTLSASLGGEIHIDGTKVRHVAYTAGSGNVPAKGTTITNSSGGITGELIGVWSAFNAAPTAAGAAMPGTGFIKMKNLTGAFTAGALTGITATSSGADVVSWIEVVGQEATTFNCNRLGIFRMTGAWFDVGTTSGSSNQTIQMPGSLANTYYPGVWIETGSGTGVYEFYPAVGTATTTGTEAARGKVVWISSQGLLRIGNSGAATNGYTPASGCKIRVPNIITLNCDGAFTTNILPNATLTTRKDFTCTGGGVVTIDKANMAWWLSLNQPYSIDITDTGILDNITITECATPLTLNNVGVGQTDLHNQFALTISAPGSVAGGDFTDCVFTASGNGTGTYVISLTDTDGFDFVRCRFQRTRIRNHATTGAGTLTRVANSLFTDCTVIDGTRWLLTTCSNMTFTNLAVIDRQSGTTLTTFTHYAFELVTSCTDITISGLSFPLPYLQPYLGILSIGATGCKRIKLRNLGTAGTPLECGGAQLNDKAWTRATTTATVTSVAHGLKANDIVYVLVSDATAAITVGAKTVASTPTADTFTFTCLNAGAASGVLTYYLQVSALLFTCVAAAAADDVRIQRCYVHGLRTNVHAIDNSSKNIVMDNVQCDTPLAPLRAELNGKLRGMLATPSLTAQTSVYGTHFYDAFVQGIGTGLSAQAWTRSTTTATVTSTAHGMKTGDIISVTVTSDAAAIVLGQKSITVLTSSTFTFTCLNAGGASGTLTYVGASGRIGLAFNEASTETADQVTIDSGTPGFTSVGTLYAPTVNQQVTFEAPDYIKGHTSFPNCLAVMAGGTIGNYDITYAIDKNDGAGYSSFKNLHYPRAGGGGSNGSTTVTMTSTTGVAAGDYVDGTNIGFHAKVVSITNSTDIVVDIANRGTVSGVLTFRQYPSETGIDASRGFKLKVRIKTTTTNATAISSLYLLTASTSTSRGYQYDLDLVPVTITVVDKDDVAIQNAQVGVFVGSTQVINADTSAGGVVSATYGGSTPANAVYKVRKSSTGATKYVSTSGPAVIATTTGMSVKVVLQADGIAAS